jgi:steroid 5-alpha reductase family enzyme
LQLVPTLIRIHLILIFPQKGLWGWSRHPPYFGEYAKSHISSFILFINNERIARIICWWGIWMLCLSPSTNGSLPSSVKSAQYGAVVSPIFTTLLLMFASGLPTAEIPQAKKFYLMSHGPNANEDNAGAWTRYQTYLRRTSILIPFPPAVYEVFPNILKRTVFLDFPIYRFDEKKDGPAAIEEERKKVAPQND